jgi:hypothetical protein
VGFLEDSRVFGVRTMLLQVTELLGHFEWVIFRVVMFIIFLYIVFDLLAKHVPIKEAFKRLIEWIFPSTKL